MNIKRIPVIISDMRENMLFSKKWVYTACLHFTKIFELSFAFNLSITLFRFHHPMLFLGCFIILFSPICRQCSFNCN